MRPAFFRRIASRWLPVVLVILSAVPGFAEVLPYGLKIEKVLDTSAEMGDIAQSPRGELWLLERTTGTIRVMTSGLETASLTLPVMSSCESGLLDVAFDPGYSNNGRAYVYYVDPTGKARVDQLTLNGLGLQANGLVLDLGTTSGGCRPGGGLALGGDGKLYVSVGDLEISSDGQNDASLAGKVLRAELDGTVPNDNASGTLLWAKGFRNGMDLHIDDTGQVYLADLGTGGVWDELNLVEEGGNYGWDLVNGNSGGVYDDPLATELSTPTPDGLTGLTAELGGQHAGGLAFTCAGAAQEIRKADLNVGGDAVDAIESFYDADADVDSTPDAACPTGFDALSSGSDGWLYGANSGANPGVWRIWNDTPGPREVSGPGSPIPMRLKKVGGDIEFAFEDLGTLDAYRPVRHGGQHVRPYQVWEGTLPVAGSYDHTSLVTVSGAPNGPRRRTALVTPSAGDRYYLITAQGDNLEGTSGKASDGSERMVDADYCTTLGYGINVNQCIKPWTNPTNGEELRLRDYNPNSPFYLQFLNVSDFRGKVVRIDYSAINCPPCQAQADVLHLVADPYRDRDLMMISVMNLQFQTLTPIPPANCASLIATWAATHGDNSPIVCDTDKDGNGLGDVIWQNWHQAGCGGVPQNMYIDQGGSIYQFVCGGEVSAASITSKIINEINPETCE